MKSAGVPSIISADVVVRGNVESVGEVQLDGELDGDVRANALIVGEQAVVRGEIACENVTVRGRVEGSIRAKAVTLASTAHIEGDILHTSLAVESGAHFEGNCRHSEDPLTETGADFRRAARPAAPSAPKPIREIAEPTTSAAKDASTPRPPANVPANGETPSFLNTNRSPLR